MKKIRNVAFGLMACLIFGTAAAQDASKAPSEPKNVDDVIANILRGTPDTAMPTRSGSPVDKSGSTVSPTLREPVVMGARIGEHPDRTRFVVELSDPVDMRTFTLSNPDRVVIDMPAVQWHLDGPPRPSGNGAVKSYRYGLFRPGNSRFVIDLNQPVVVSDALVLPPEDGHGYRVVFDLFPTTQAKFDRTAGWPADLKAKENAAESVASLPPSPPTGQHVATRKIVVIDPGHGGIDSGTIGEDGTMEKNIVLAEGLRLRKVLQTRGYDVHMTRDSDVFIPLGERVKIARAAHADLFISIHADSIHDPNVEGLSIYTLSEKGSDREAAALASKENQSDIIAGVDLSGDNSTVAPILIDLAQRDTMNKSSHFAETALSELSHATDILPRKPHRSGALVVLKAPDVPAVLIELGYLSNTHDESQMKTVTWRDRVANAIAGAVDRYFAVPAGGGPETAQRMR
ncbi:MAG: N-acetylmuramoyl-L-alanine amidase [Alphaproteobacteria bacterium]|nr:N-acetylmuramoyl-L-alanine amidase [Alphaproteobacteria bacterium]MDE2110836.1 N-acetylmuramoyl-L-alanine amidase [Alphaproteobacteria bacterium]MDE2495490.1 N-acetylmuramoyl-L-alanine amidase [Alphaproteobacteria bacterium]